MKYSHLGVTYAGREYTLYHNTELKDKLRMALKTKDKAKTNGVASKGVDLKNLAVATHKAGSIQKLKQEASRQPSKELRIKADEAVTIRFLAEPSDWVGFAEHSIQAGTTWSYVPCMGEGRCPQDGENRARNVWYANVVNVEDGKVYLFKMGQQIVQEFVIKAERYDSKNQGGLTDRDFEILRTGSGLDTTYHIEAQEKGPLRVDGKKVVSKDIKEIDPEQYLLERLKNYYGAGVSDKPKNSVVEEDDDEDEDEDTNEEEEDDDDETDDDDDADGDDDEDDEDEEDDDEEEEEKPAKKPARKPLGKAGRRK